MAHSLRRTPLLVVVLTLLVPTLAVTQQTGRGTVTATATGAASPLFHASPAPVATPTGLGELVSHERPMAQAHPYLSRNGAASIDTDTRVKILYLAVAAGGLYYYHTKQTDDDPETHGMVGFGVGIFGAVSFLTAVLTDM